MKSPHVYDKAKYHTQSLEDHGLPDEHAENHTVVILRWLIENDLMSDFFKKEGASALYSFQRGSFSIHQVYGWWDRCLIDDMLSERGNAFAMHYFDFQKGKYLTDYATTLQGSLPSEFHIVYSEENYQKLKPIIDRAYEKWIAPKRWWWPF